MPYKLAAFALLTLFVTGCPKTEQAAYSTVVAAKAFTDKITSQHPECLAVTVSTAKVCVALRTAVAAKDTLIDAVEIYCAGPTFDGGGACNPPASGTPALAQAQAKLSAALAMYQQAEKDLKGVL